MEDPRVDTRSDYPVAPERGSGRLTAAITAFAGTAVLVLAGPGVGSPAHAAEGDPVIVSPVAAEVVADGWTGPVTVDFADAAESLYEVELSCWPGEYTWHEQWSWSGQSERLVSWEIPPLPTARQCTVRVWPSSQWAWEAGDPEVEFHTDGPPLEVTATQSPTEFTPLNKDGRSDRTVTTYAVNQVADVDLAVRNPNGRIVARRSVGWVRTTDPRTWTWDGRGTTKAGAYTIEVAAATLRGTTDVATTTVTVAPYEPEVIKPRHAWGSFTTSRSTGKLRYLIERMPNEDMTAMQRQFWIRTDAKAPVGYRVTFGTGLRERVMTGSLDTTHHRRSGMPRFDYAVLRKGETWKNIRVTQLR